MMMKVVHIEVQHSRSGPFTFSARVFLESEKILIEFQNRKKKMSWIRKKYRDGSSNHVSYHF